MEISWNEGVRDDETERPFGNPSQSSDMGWVALSHDSSAREQTDFDATVVRGKESARPRTSDPRPEPRRQSVGTLDWHDQNDYFRRRDTA